MPLNKQSAAQAKLPEQLIRILEHPGFDPDKLTITTPLGEKQIKLLELHAGAEWKAKLFAAPVATPVAAAGPVEVKK